MTTLGEATIATHGKVLPWHLAAWQRMQANARLPQALLITGPDGSGLPWFALALVQAQLCPDTDQHGIACGRCNSCDWFANGHHPDVLRIGSDVTVAAEVDAEAGEGKSKAADSREDSAKSRNIPVADVRRAIGFLQVASNGDAGRFVIVSPADGMNSAAGNALLKILEEPPNDSTLVLVSSRETRLLPTVRSRCQVVRLTRPGRQDAMRWLGDQGTANAALALDLAGQAPIAATAFDADYWSARTRFIGALERGDGGQQALLAVGDVLPTSLLLQFLHTWVCDCLTHAQTGRIRYHTDQVTAVARAARRQDNAALIAFEQRLREARRLVDHPLNPKLVAGDLLLAYAACESRP